MFPWKSIRCVKAAWNVAPYREDFDKMVKIIVGMTIEVRSCWNAKFGQMRQNLVGGSSMYMERMEQ